MKPASTIFYILIFKLFLNQNPTAFKLINQKNATVDDIIFRPKEFVDDCEYRKLPSALIIGVKKSGTYALLRYLQINPKIKAALRINGCNLNEIHYFDFDVNYNKGVEWYRSQMPSVCESEDKSQFVVIEKTPGYFRSEKAPQRIFNYNQNTKLILIVRDPVKRVQSELTHCDTRQKKLNLDRKCLKMNQYFESLFKNHTNSTNTDYTSIYRELETNRFIRNSIYYLDILKWLNYFSINNIYVLNGENFIKTPWLELNKLEEFLNVSKYINKKHFHFDKNKNFYCLRRNYNELDINSNNKSNYKLYADCLGKNKGRKNHVYLSEFIKVELKKYFYEWNRLFFDKIGKNFNW